MIQDYRTNKWTLYRHGISAITQAWYQIDQILPDEIREQRRAVSSALLDLSDALFEAETKEVKEARERNTRE